jgi:phage-related protein
MKLKYIKHYTEFINENVTTFTDELLDKISTVVNSMVNHRNSFVDLTHTGLTANPLAVSWF